MIVCVFSCWRVVPEPPTWSKDMVQGHVQDNTNITICDIISIVQGENEDIEEVV